MVQKDLPEVSLLLVEKFLNGTLWTVIYLETFSIIEISIIIKVINIVGLVKYHENLWFVRLDKDNYVVPKDISETLFLFVKKFTNKILQIN